MKSSLHTTTSQKSLKLLADFWNLRILEALAETELRFCALQRALDDVNPTTLTKKLSLLEEAGLIERSAESRGQQVNYSLTKCGQASLPVLSAIQNFSKHLKH